MSFRMRGHVKLAEFCDLRIAGFDVPAIMTVSSNIEADAQEADQYQVKKFRVSEFRFKGVCTWS